MNILGIDPGLGTTGYGIISNTNNNMKLQHNNMDVDINLLKRLDEKVNGKMLGIQLVKELIKVGEAKGCYRISLFCDKKLVKFYERNGFKVNNVMMKKFIK